MLSGSKASRGAAMRGLSGPTQTSAFSSSRKVMGQEGLCPYLVLASSRRASKSSLRQADVGPLPLGPSSNGSSSSSAFCSADQPRTQVKSGELD